MIEAAAAVAPSRAPISARDSRAHPAIVADSLVGLLGSGASDKAIHEPDPSLPDAPGRVSSTSAAARPRRRPPRLGTRGDAAGSARGLLESSARSMGSGHGSANDDTVSATGDHAVGRSSS